MTKNEKTKNIFTWGWRRFSSDWLELEKNKQKQSTKSVVLSVAAAFFIVVFSAQALGWVNNLVEQKYLLEKYKNANVILYSNIG
ncbi:hypothetical protein COU00_03300 [Candidatus Falkowbacteria bacterium CG10_big_fil_rev_8_21_14_0_10_43_11]|uniref:Uncharacterized protein n=1 Tax=Candidatus Falkowbacteria bacterium CG10_big_fil_rev_8_21_14_0_10_43_11 TaxID=1974568 RepID=A0A2M6WLF8_9BACT|nr:MAG: hypothetical protein COU00_03300 [Candidatus Falkowbacteria bacterium CG10_big_fil_rev_8_21_14_0_10_43_11]